MQRLGLLTYFEPPVISAFGVDEMLRAPRSSNDLNCSSSIGTRSCPTLWT